MPEEVWPGPQPAQMGNLNKNSTHPNPWYPPTEYERIRGMVPPYRILHRNEDPIGPVKKAPNFLEDNPFLENVWWGGKTGFMVGTALAMNDIINVNSIDANRARFFRYCFIVPPYIAMGVSWVCARELLGNVSKEKDAQWSYPVAMLAPAAIWGIFKNSFERGARVAIFGGGAAWLWKYNKDVGDAFQPDKNASSSFQYGWQTSKDYDHERKLYKQQHFDAEGWKGWPFAIDSVKTWWTPTEEPRWKKHVSPEEAEKGPPTNF